MLQVTVYTPPAPEAGPAPICQGCRATKRKLDELDIDYTPVAMSEEDAERFRNMDLKQAPVVEVDLGAGAFWHWSGHRPSEIERLLHAYDCADEICGQCEAVIAA